MADETTNPEGGAPAFTPEEQASIEVGQRGFAEPTNVNTPTPSGPQRPENVPEKFWKDGKVDTEALLASYTQLEGKLGGGSQQAPEAQPEAAAPARTDGKIEKPEAAPEAAASAPVTAAIEAAREEWAASGEISADGYAALEAAGLPKQVVDLYINGLKADAAQTMATIHGIVGSEDTYNSMIAWAGKNLSDAEIDAFNDSLDNPALRETAVMGLHAKFTRAAPSEGKLMTPNDTGAASADVFRSRDELISAQRDPRYATDAVYRQSVVDKLSRSHKVGFAAFERPKFERTILSN